MNLESSNLIDKLQLGMIEYNIIIILHYRHYYLLFYHSLGITVVLSYPYSREVDEQHLYTEVHHHAVTRMINTTVIEESDSDSYDLPDTDSSPEVDSLHRRLQQITPVSATLEPYIICIISLLFYLSLSLSFKCSKLT